MICIANVQQETRQTEKAINLTIRVNDFNCKLDVRARSLFYWVPKSAIASQKDDCVYIKNWAVKIVDKLIADAKPYSIAVGLGKTKKEAWTEMNTRQAKKQAAAKAR